MQKVLTFATMEEKLSTLRFIEYLDSMSESLRVNQGSRELYLI